MEPQPNPESAPVVQAPAQSTPQPMLNINSEKPVDGLNYATLLNRFIAAVIDGLILGVASFVLLIPIGAIIAAIAITTSSDASFGVGGGLFQLILLALYIGYAGYFESSKYQATPGKIIMKLKVTDTKGARLVFQHALKRNFFKNITSVVVLLAMFIPFLGWFTGLIGLGWLLANVYFIYSDMYKQSVYDKLANTVVLNA